jgi:hypothetical protein
LKALVPPAVGRAHASNTVNSSLFSVTMMDIQIPVSSPPFLVPLAIGLSQSLLLTFNSVARIVLIPPKRPPHDKSKESANH